MQTQTEQNQYNAHLEDEAEIEVLETQLMSIDQSEINQQIATAHRFPRSLKRFKDRALEMATIDQETAESCFYVLPRAGKKIEGPSVRLAEIVGSAYTNMRYAAKLVSEDEKYVTAQGAAFDLENNVAMTIEVRRKITDKYGKRYNDDMIQTTANAACSIALRNAIFRVVPMAFVQTIYLAAKKAAVGDVQTLESRRDRMLAHFAKMGVDKEKIFAYLGAEGIEDVGLKELETLIGISTAIKDGETTVDETFNAKPVEAQAKTKTEAVAETLKKKKQEINGEHENKESIAQA